MNSSKFFLKFRLFDILIGPFALVTTESSESSLALHLSILHANIHFGFHYSSHITIRSDSCVLVPKDNLFDILVMDVLSPNNVNLTCELQYPNVDIRRELLV
jgi:hypothetical protein